MPTGLPFHRDVWGFPATRAAWSNNPIGDFGQTSHRASFLFDAMAFVTVTRADGSNNTQIRRHRAKKSDANEVTGL